MRSLIEIAQKDVDNVIDLYRDNNDKFAVHFTKPGKLDFFDLMSLQFTEPHLIVEKKNRELFFNEEVISEEEFEAKLLALKEQILGG